MNNQAVEAEIKRAVSIAILHCAGKFLMQLRDDIPGIAYPGQWGLFGGHVEPGESPEEAMERELFEEISYIPPTITKFGEYEDSQVIRHVYHAPLIVDLQELVLQEGWDMGLLTPEDIRRGSCFSQKAGKEQPLGRPHQQILLDFVKKEFRSQESGVGS